MTYSDLNILKLKIDSIAVFRGLLDDAVMSSLYNYLNNPTVSGYSKFVANLYKANKGNLGKHINDICENDENVYVKAVGNGDEGSSHLDMFSLEMFENIAYIMAKHADPTIPDSPEEWLDEFSTFSIYQVLPKIIELWGLNVQTDVESKKNFTQQTAR